MLNGYITNLGKYNEGKLVGKWIEFPITEEELEEVLDSDDTEVIEAIMEAVTSNIREAIEIFETGAERYFDYKAFARDLSFDGYTETSNGVIYYC